MSNTTYCRGLLSRSRFCSNWKDGRPWSSRATISPSSTACFALTSPLIACSCGYSLSTIRPERVCSETLPLSMKLISLMPSHLTSKSQRSLSNGSSTSWAFIGSRLLGIGAFSALARLISPPSPSARLLDQAVLAGGLGGAFRLGRLVEIAFALVLGKRTRHRIQFDSLPSFGQAPS